jgi:hypothetical protein
MAAREMGHLHLPDALSLVVLYAATDNPRFDRAAGEAGARRPALRLPDVRGISADMTDFRGTAAELFVATKTEFESERPAGWRVSRQIKLL